MRRTLPLLAGVLAGGAAHAAGFTDYGQDLTPREHAAVEVTGALRTRVEGLYNFDLDRGTNAQGIPLFPVPIGDPGAQLLTAADGRLRTDISFFAPGGMAAVKVRADLLDNWELGASPTLTPGTGSAATPAGSLSQQPGQGLRIKRAYGEFLTPVGLLAAGRMGAHWGAGMLTNSGDCLDCDSGDAADRIAFISPIAGHLWALAYDFTYAGPTLARPNNSRMVELDPSAAVRTLTFAVLRYRDDWGRERRRAAGKSTLEYGAYVSLRGQSQDVPGAYLPLSLPVTVDSSQVVYRGFQATALDAWGRLTLPWGHIQAEAALLLAQVAQASLVPGVLLANPIHATQSGAVVQSDFGEPSARFGAGVDLGYASGDSAQYGVDNFRFASDFRVDQILFRELLGTVTNAMYFRPHARVRLYRSATAQLELSVALIASRAVSASGTPSGQAPLGVEIDPTLSLDTKLGFSALLEHALFLPGAGFDNPAQGLSAQPAQMLRLRLAYVF